MARGWIAAAVSALALTACAWGYDDYGYGHGRDLRAGPAYRGEQWAGVREPFRGELTGPGVEILDEWLKNTDEGQAIVTLGFRDAGEGVISEDVAHRANIWFRRYADQNRDMTITDPEIRTALVAASRRYAGGAR
jgi:hypothetical protein